MQLFSKVCQFSIGRLKLVASDLSLVAVLWESERTGRASLSEPVNDDTHPILTRTEDQLNDYFQGKQTSFNLPMSSAGTPFQQSVWKKIADIPFGHVKSYEEVAESLGMAGACRAVGTASGKNPLLIVVPCHRVIAKSGRLTGFRGGLEAKRKLLNLEGHRY